MSLVTPQIRELIRLALEEDLGRGDLTAAAVPEAAIATATVIARAPTVASGLGLVEAIFAESGGTLEKLSLLARDGEELASGQELFRLRGSARLLLGVERTLLNFLQRTCGIATFAAAFAEKTAGLGVRIVDTRKTLPGWRALDKQSVRDGGLQNHRFGLDGGVLLKENHLRAAGGITAAVANLKGKVPHGIEIECEVTTLEEAREAIAAGVRLLLLDNIAASELAGVVRELREIRTGLVLEASGNVNLATVAEYARTGVDIISVGALTHSAPAANLSMLFDFSS